MLALYPIVEKTAHFKADQDSKNTTSMSIQETLDEIVSRIVERFHPDKIILFGSQVAIAQRVREAVKTFLQQ